MPLNLYEILEVSPSASKADIKRAYKSMALKTHPDRAPPEQKAEAEAAFQKVNAAYEVLCDDSARREYDLTGRVPKNPAFGDAESSSRSQAQNPHYDPFFGPFQGFPSGLFSFDPFSAPFGQRANRASSSPFGGNMFSMNRPFHSTSPFSPFHEALDDIFDDVSPANRFPPRTQFPSAFLQNQTTTNSQNSRVPFHSSTFTSTTYSSRGSNGQWVSQSQSETIVNGQRESSRSWVDENGTKHVKYKYADGSTRYTRDGIEQPTGEMLPLPPTSSGTSTSRGSSHRYRG